MNKMLRLKERSRGYILHGLSAFRGVRGNEPSYNAIDTALDSCISKEIAGCDRPVGSIGACFSGTLEQAFEGDVWSELNARGERYPTSVRGVNMFRPSYEEYIELCDKFNGEAGSWSQHDYCEAFFSPDEVFFIWVKSWASASLKADAQKLADKYNCQLVTMKNGQQRLGSNRDNSVISGVKGFVSDHDLEVQKAVVGESYYGFLKIGDTYLKDLVGVPFSLELGSKLYSFKKDGYDDVVVVPYVKDEGDDWDIIDDTLVVSSYYSSKYEEYEEELPLGNFWA